ncbi:MAG: hypothetical protein HYY13_08470 [Nitrospirae bacterium]|nr:hypothetical protein [Nitrospirota bacterium]
MSVWGARHGSDVAWAWPSLARRSGARFPLLLAVFSLAINTCGGGSCLLLPEDEEKAGLADYVAPARQTVSGVVRDDLAGGGVVGAHVTLAVWAPTSGKAAVARGGGRTRPVVKSYEAVTGARGEFAIRDVQVLQGSSAQLTIKRDGYSETFKSLAYEELIGGEIHASDIALRPVMYSRALDSRRSVQTPDGSVQIRLSEKLQCDPACTHPDDPVLAAGPTTVVADVSVIDPTTDADAFPVGFEGTYTTDEKGNVTLCHAPPGNSEAAKTLSVNASAVSGHLAHGDTIGACAGDAAAAKEAEADEEAVQIPVQLEPVAAAHFDLRTKSGHMIDALVKPDTPAEVTIEVPPTLQEKVLDAYDKGERTMPAFHFDGGAGTWVRDGEARLVVVEEQAVRTKIDEDGETTEVKERVRKVLAEAEVTKTCWVVVAQEKQGVCIEGKVIGPDKAAAKGVWVRGDGLRGHARAYARTRPDGKYRLFVARGETVRISVHRRKEESDTEEGEGLLVDAGAEPSSEGCIEAADLALPDHGTITGRLLDRSGQPVQGTVVTSQGEAADIGADGAFSVDADADTESLRVVGLAGGQPVSLEVPVGAVAEGATVDVGTVTVAAPVAITGEVREEDGTPIVEAVVEAAGAVTETDSSGKYTISVPATDKPVEITISGMTQEGEPLAATIEVSTAGAAQVKAPEVKIDLDPMCVAGRVVDHRGRGLRGSTVRVGSSQVVLTDDEGLFRATVLADGDVAVSARHREGAIDETLERIVRPVKGGACEEVELRLDTRPAWVSGRVTRGSGGRGIVARVRRAISRGDPLEGVQVVSSNGAVTTTEFDGHYRIPVERDASVTLVFTLGEAREEEAVTTRERGSVTFLDVEMDIEDAPPVVREVETSSEATRPGGTVEIEVTVADEGAIKYEVASPTGGTVDTTGGTAPATEEGTTVTVTWSAPQEPGVYDVPVTITDAGGQTTTATVTIEVHTENEAPSVVDVAATTEAPVPGEKVTVTAAADDSEGDALTYDWALTGSDGTDLSSLLSEPTEGAVAFVTPIVPEGTELTLSVEVTDALGATTTSTTEIEVSDGSLRPEAETAVPETTVATKPPDVSTATTQTVTFSSDVAGTKYQCSLDGAEPKLYEASATFEGLSDGTHTLVVQALAPDGSVDPVPEVITWVVDTNAPVTKITQKPDAVTKSTTATFAIEAGEKGATYECRLDSTALATCVGRTCTPPAGDLWTKRAPMPTPRNWPAAAVVGGKIYVMGGWGGTSPTQYALSVVEVYDPVSDSWSSAKPLPAPRSRAGAAVIGGKVYVAGGINKAGGLKTLEVYDPATDQWTTKAPALTTRWESAVAVVGEHLYVVGGGSNAAEEYDPATDKWTSKAPLSSNRWDVGVAAVGGKLYVMGGIASGSTLAVASLDEFDPSSNTWTTKASIPTARRFVAAAEVNGKIYALGGTPKGAGSFGVVEEFDPATNTWTARAALPTPRNGVAAVALGGKLFAVGGFAVGTQAATNVLEEYTPPPTSAACLQPLVTVSYSGLAEGSHTFEAVAIDSTAKRDLTPETFTWTVDLTPPTFAGATAVSAAGAGKATLTWSAGSDTVTPAASLAYDVCVSTKSGGCCGDSFTAAHASTAGSTSFTVEGMSGGLVHYFVVKARDAAGNRDTNQVERSVTVPAAAPARLPGLGSYIAPVRNSKAGAQHACSVDPSGVVACWGLNALGQLGTGNWLDALVPSPVIGLGPASSVAAGGYHTCALEAGGTVSCWGSNAFGQLGNGSWSDAETPVRVPDLDGVTGLSAGERHACALLGDGRVKCWGWNAYGQAGDGTSTDARVPVEVKGVEAAADISAGGGHTCAVLSDGRVTCWGHNGYGQLGNGTLGDSRLPVEVVGIRDAVDVELGAFHSCATVRSGAVKCWGHNGYGQLGTGTLEDAAIPVDAPDLSGARELTVKDFFTCATKTGERTCVGYGAK